MAGTPPRKRATKPPVQNDSPELREIKAILDIVHKQVDSMGKTVNSLNEAMVGNDYGQKGIVRQINEHEEYIDKDRNFKERLAGGTIVGGIIWSFCLKFLFK